MPHPAWSTAATAPRRWTTAMAVGRAALQAARFWEIVRILSHRILRALRCDEPAWADPRRSHPSAVLLPPTRPLAAICQCDQGFAGHHCQYSAEELCLGRGDPQDDGGLADFRISENHNCQRATPPLSSQAPALALLDMAVRSLPPGLHTSRSTHLTLLTFGTRSDMQFRVLR